MQLFPSSTIINKTLSKKALFGNYDGSPVTKEKFDADISKIVIAYEVSSLTTPIDKGLEVSSFFVLNVTLKRKNFDEKNIVLISRLINQKLLFFLEYNDKAKLAVYHTKLFQSDWYPKDKLTFELLGSNLDAVWEDIIIQVGNITVKPGITLDEQIKINEECDKLLHQIEV